jgi:AbrB family looped-hinge helix DNA binding protein
MHFRWLRCCHFELGLLRGPSGGDNFPFPFVVRRVRLSHEFVDASSKGQLVIPIRLRKALNLRPGDKVELTLEGQRLILERQSPRNARLVRGKFGRPVLVAAPGAPAITTRRVNLLLDELS